MGDEHATELLAYMAQETVLFHEHLDAAVKAYEETKELPKSLFGAKAVKGVKKRKKGDGPKRKPSAFNIFMKERLNAIKAKEPGGDHKQVFKRVTAEWAALSDAKKAAYKAKVEAAAAAEAAAGGGGGGGGGGSDSDSSSDDDAPPPPKKKGGAKKK